MADKKTVKPKTTMAISLSLKISEFANMKPNAVREKLWEHLEKAGYTKPTMKSGFKTQIHKTVSKMDIETQKKVLELAKAKGLI